MFSFSLRVVFLRSLIDSRDTLELQRIHKHKYAFFHILCSVSSFVRKFFFSPLIRYLYHLIWWPRWRVILVVRQCSEWRRALGLFLLLFASFAYVLICSVGDCFANRFCAVIRRWWWFLLSFWDSDSCRTAKYHESLFIGTNNIKKALQRHSLRFVCFVVCAFVCERR